MKPLWQQGQQHGKTKSRGQDSPVPGEAGEAEGGDALRTAAGEG